MKTKIFAIALCLLTGVSIVFYPLSNAQSSPKPHIPKIDPVKVNDTPKIELVFVLDTTGSMGGLIQAAKEKIWSIASTMASAQPTPEIKIGLVAYRDRGDSYITKVVDLSKDLDSMYATLMDFQAGGGGDGPESVNQALYEAVHKISWSQNQDSYKVVFLVGDAPPHMDYQNEIQYPQILRTAQQKGIAVNTIQCGEDPSTVKPWQQIAQLGTGRYFQVAQAGSAVAMSTPYDERLAKLSEKMDKTRMYYGDKKTLEEKRRKIAATKKLNRNSSVASRARRGIFNSSAGGEGNFIGSNELVEDIASGKVDLAEIKVDTLPKPMQAMSPKAQEALVKDTVAKRAKLKQEMLALAGQRKEYIERKIQEKGGAKDSLDEKIFSAVREQAKVKGLKYDDDSLGY